MFDIEHFSPQSGHIIVKNAMVTDIIEHKNTYRHDSAQQLVIINSLD